MNVTGNNGGLDGRKDFLSELAKASGKVSEMESGILITNPINGYMEVASFGYSPIELAEQLTKIAEAITMGVLEESLKRGISEFGSSLDKYQE